MVFHLLYIIRKTLKGRKQTNVKEGQCGTYLRLTRASSGPRVSVAKTYRDENETKILARYLYVLVTLTRGPDDALVSLR